MPSNLSSNPYKEDVRGTSRNPIRLRGFLSSFILFFRRIGLFAIIGYVLMWYGMESLHMSLYSGRPEYLFLRGPLSIFKHYLFLLTPILEGQSRQVLQQLFFSHETIFGHSNEAKWYDPEQHNNAYRQIHTGLLTEEECSVMRSLIEHNLPGHLASSNYGWSEALTLEFQNRPIIDILQNPGEYTTHEENQLLRDVLFRIQLFAEEKFDDDNIYIEFADGTVRRHNLYEEEELEMQSSNRNLLNWVRRAYREVWYDTSSGHGMHADQCRLMPENIDNESKEFKIWTEPWKCKLVSDHCCRDRTHSVLLYLNDESQIEGGELYMIDRFDLDDKDYDINKNNTPNMTQNPKNFHSKVPMFRLSENVLKIKPKCGTLAMFASDARNIHGTYPIKSGKRYAMPMWFTSFQSLPITDFTNSDQSPNETSDIKSHNISEEELEMIENKARRYCEYEGGGDYYPPPLGLRQTHEFDCDEWINDFMF